MNLMQRMKNVMHSVVRCLVSSILFVLFTIPAYSNDVEYIRGVGCVRNEDGSLDRGKSIRQAIDNLYEKVLEYCGYQVSSHAVLKNDNGKQDYKNVTAVDKGALLLREGIELIPMEGYWVARIEKSKIQQQDVKWVEQNVTINNTYNEAPTYSRGYERKKSTTRTTRRTDVIGPSGKVVDSKQGKSTTTTTRKNWNGRYGYTWETTQNY